MHHIKTLWVGQFFFDYVPSQSKGKGQILFSVVQSTNSTRNCEFLSEGERTLVGLAIFIAFNYLNSPPLIILDEIDSHLDLLNLEKLFCLLKKIEKKKKWNILIITQKRNLGFCFSGSAGIYKCINGSKICLLKC